ncbi:hypothetical protein FHS43_000411 [Streptosporangium becharense]|uniref:Peptidase n=1 Tax=Streptosporangium becharense TaxID=1816182 RepID=A0A7W9IGC8_9ACTN|nr:hypothetical protein [Streptosporangium becharense]MBB2909165.1 hypothetical protein [Streptosporangium becharense]MBB5819816.1 hypothetical protein [Streptosporangium becharense]
MRIRSILSLVALAGGLAPLCQPAHAVVSKPQQGVIVATDIVDYRCTTTGVAEKQDIKVKVELMMPPDATPGKQMTIEWRGVYVDDTSALKAPATGLADGTELYAYASISGFPGLTSATGVGEIDTLSAGQTIPLPMTTVSLKTTPSSTGTATVRPAAINFGTRTNEPSIQCEVRNPTALTTYTLTVASADDRPADSVPVTPSPQPSDTATASADDQSPDDPAPVTSSSRPTDAEEGGRVIETPSGGAATGGGGQAGPDGRVLVLTGFLLILAAGTGLLLRRRSPSRG